MSRFLSSVIANGLVAGAVVVLAQAPATPPVGASGAGRAGAPTRDPHTAGYVTAWNLKK